MGSRSQAKPLDPPESPRADGESWEQYARRLEKRIKRQRDQLESLNEKRGDAANRAERKRIERLLFALGRMTEKYDEEQHYLVQVLEKEKT